MLDVGSYSAFFFCSINDDKISSDAQCSNIVKTQFYESLVMVPHPFLPLFS